MIADSHPLDLRQALAPGAAGAFTTKQDFVASLLRHAIVAGTLAPGQHLRQEEVARQLGLSWTPVREAFRLLEAEGWLTIGRHRGAVVSLLSRDDFEDIYLLRLANEPTAARLSAERMTDAVLAEMETLYERMQQLDLRQTVDWPRFLEIERAFHQAQYQVVRRRRLLDLVMSLRDASERYLRASFAIGDEPSQHRQVHADLLRACRERDGQAAEDTIRRALERVRARMVPILARVLDDQDGQTSATG